jgi:nickel transport protein
MNAFQDISGRIHNTATTLFLICLTTMFLASPSPVFAHKVSIFAWVEGDMVHTQSIFFGGKKIQNASIEVFDASGKQLIEGKTNDNGEFSFRTPIKAAMKIVVSAGMGHQGVWNLKASDFESTGRDIPYPEPASSPGMPTIQSPISHTEIPSPPKAHPGVTSDEIRDIVEKALDKKLNPVLKMLSESKNRAPSIGDILGGIGYIIGLVGLAAYIGSRKKRDNLSK